MEGLKVILDIVGIIYVVKSSVNDDSVDDIDYINNRRPSLLYMASREISWRCLIIGRIP